MQLHKLATVALALLVLASGAAVALPNQAADSAHEHANEKADDAPQGPPDWVPGAAATGPPDHAGEDDDDAAEDGEYDGNETEDADDDEADEDGAADDEYERNETEEADGADDADADGGDEHEAAEEAEDAEYEVNETDDAGEMDAEDDTDAVNDSADEENGQRAVAGERAAKRWPPSDLPTAVPDHVSAIHDVIRSVPNGDLDGPLGPAVSDVPLVDG